MTSHNPVKILREVPPERLRALAQDPSFLRRYDAVMVSFDADMKAQEGWTSRTYPQLARTTIAYFSAEFGIHNTLPIYGGGLGILAGDHCKEASDLGLPLVGVGFMYPQGYFHQRLSVDGRQEAVPAGGAARRLVLACWRPATYRRRMEQRTCTLLLASLAIVCPVAAGNSFKAFATRRISHSTASSSVSMACARQQDDHP